MKRIINYLLVLSLLVTCMVFASPQVVMAGTQATYYVSTTGDDDDPGTFAEPFLTIEHARDVVQTINSDMTGDIIVNLRGGTYTLDSALELTSADSGTNGYNVIYQRYESEEVIISGGVSVTGWSLYDEGNNIYRASVGTGFYSRDLFVDGVRAQRARSEKNPAGFTYDEDHGFELPGSGTYSGMASWGNKTDIELHQSQSYGCPWGSVSTIASGAITMKNPFWTANVTMVESNLGMNYPEYIENAYELLDAEGEWYLNRTTGYIYYKPASGHDPNNDTIVLGKLEKIIDGNSGGSLNSMLHNVKFIAIIFEHTTYLEPLTNQGRNDHYGGVQIRIDDPEDPSYDVLTYSALDFNFSKNISIEYCAVMHTGASGIGFRLGSQDNILNYNYLYDIGLNGINLGDIHYQFYIGAVTYDNGQNELGMYDRAPSDSRCIVSGNQVTNNTITEVGSAIPAAVGIFTGFVRDTLIDHNTIYNLPYSGISAGYGWGYADYFVDFDTAAIGNNTITYNRIYDLMHLMYDGGGIYTHGQANGTLVKYNYVYGQHERYALLYIDAASVGITATDNVLSSYDGACADWTLLQNYYTEDKYWMQSNNNDVEYNYYSSNLDIYHTASRNTLANNICVTGSWDAHATDIIYCSGSGNGTVTTNNTLRGVNLSLGETASASDYVGSNTATMAIDGKTNTYWYSDETSTAWLEVNFGSNTTFNTTVLKENLAIGQNIKDYQIQYWDGDSWENAYDSDGDSPNSTEINVFTAVTASKVRLYISDVDGTGPSVLEFEVYNTTIPSYYKILNRASTTANYPDNQALVMSPYNLSAGATSLWTLSYQQSTAQKWSIVSLGSGEYYIQNMYSYLVMTPGGFATSEGTVLYQYDWSNDDSQHYQLVPNGDGYFKIKSAESSMIVTPYGHSYDITYLILSADDGTIDQHWALDAIQ